MSGGFHVSTGGRSQTNFANELLVLAPIIHSVKMVGTAFRGQRERGRNSGEETKFSETRCVYLAFYILKSYSIVYLTIVNSNSVRKIKRFSVWPQSDE